MAIIVGSAIIASITNSMVDFPLISYNNRDNLSLIETIPLINLSLIETISLINLSLIETIH